jgi:hypothetical protein
MAHNYNCPDEVNKTGAEQKLKGSSNTFQTINLCPVNGQKGNLVQNQTVKALLKISLRSVRETEYFFCTAQDCSVVYFTGDGTQTFTVDQLREVVYQKEPRNPIVPVCYCFQHTVGQLQSGSRQQKQAIVSNIKQGITAGQCACDLRNPQGSCCLGNVNKLIKQSGEQF